MTTVVFGQYLPGNSWAHRMDPRMKIILLILAIIIPFLFPIQETWGLYAMIAYVCFIALVLLSSKIPFGKMIQGLKPMVFLLLFTFVLQAISFQDENPMNFIMHVNYLTIGITIGFTALIILIKKMKWMKSYLFLIWIVGIVLAFHLIGVKDLTSFSVVYYQAGIIRGIFVFLRLIAVLLLSSFLTFTTMPMDINHALESLLSPLHVLHVPVGTISMLLSITLRFIPTLLEEVQKIIKAQAARGVSFEEGSIKQKMMQIVSLLIPMLSVNLKKAEELANAMEVRGYVLEAPRTKLDELKMHGRDILACLFMSTLLIGVMVCRIIF